MSEIGVGRMRMAKAVNLSKEGCVAYARVMVEEAIEDVENAESADDLQKRLRSAREHLDDDGKEARRILRETMQLVDAQEVLQ